MTRNDLYRLFQLSEISSLRGQCFLKCSCSLPNSVTTVGSCLFCHHNCCSAGCDRYITKWLQYFTIDL